jgi:O-acetyl-ADP-ribose deacetylase (regulator of RNase III)
VGVMGKGIALQVKMAFPQVFSAYKRAADAGELRPGKMHIVSTGKVTNPRYIINFPTKKDWKGKARLDYIVDGLNDLIVVIREKGIASIAVPPLGCGNGGLRWSEVRPVIERALAAVPDVDVLLFAPEGAPEVERMRVATKRPNMSPGLAALLGLFEKYLIVGYELTLLEAQKLAYFLHVVDEPSMKELAFQKGTYGPYSETLNHMLQRMEGHYIRGFGDNTQGRYAELHTLPGADEAAAAVLNPDTRNRIERVAQLIQGFETPYGMELLATVLWVARTEPAIAWDVTSTAKRVHDWNAHKKASFSEEHVTVAWEQLRAQAWLPLPS